MPTLTRPGVYVSTSSFPTYVSSSPGTASACFVGVCPRGPVIPTRVNSWREFTNLFGGFETAYPPSLLHLAVYTFFSAGGSSAMIIRSYRTDASGPTLATTTVNDQATTAVPTLQINADNVGAWGNNLWVNIIPGTQKDSLGSITSFTIQVMYKGSAPANVVETAGSVHVAGVQRPGREQLRHQHRQQPLHRVELHQPGRQGSHQRQPTQCG